MIYSIWGTIECELQFFTYHAPALIAQLTSQIDCYSGKKRFNRNLSGHSRFTHAHSPKTFFSSSCWLSFLFCCFCLLLFAHFYYYQNRTWMNFAWNRRFALNKFIFREKSIFSCEWGPIGASWSTKAELYSKQRHAKHSIFNFKSSIKRNGKANKRREPQTF